MSTELIDLVTQQSKKLDEHLEHLRKSLHETNTNLQGVIGTVQLTRQELRHSDTLQAERLESIRSGMERLKKELDDMDVEMSEFSELKSRVDTMYTTYNVLQKAILVAIAGGILYATVLVTKIKTGI
jgi:septation ring formation regulator EzrA